MDIKEIIKIFGLAEDATEEDVRTAIEQADIINISIGGNNFLLGNINSLLYDGIVKKEDDQVRLSNRSNPYGFTVNANAEWKGISLQLQFNANWGGYSFVPAQALKPYYGMEATNMPSFWNVDNMFVYQDVKDEAGNVLVAENRNAKYPNLAYSSINSETSNFWRVSGTQVRLNRLTLAYRIPAKFTKKFGISNLRFNITGQNLLSFYNPMPDNFYDPMGGNYGSYPRLRKWTIGVNASF